MDKKNISAILNDTKNRNLKKLDFSTKPWNKNVNEKLSSIPFEIFEFTQLEELNLSYNNLKSIPKEIAKLKNLKILRLNGNQLTSLPLQLGEMSKLESLSLNNNKLIVLPDSIGKLQKLNHLSISKNKITNLPEWILKLTNLSFLDIGFNDLAILPEWIGLISNLRYINLGGLKLFAIPKWISNLKNLEQLELACNELTDLPDWLTNLQNLKNLELSANNLKIFPKDITQLTGIESLRLWVNNISEVPNSIGELKNLKSLVLSGNALLTLPDSISKLQKLTDLDLGNNCLKEVPDCIFTLKSLESLDLMNAYSWGMYDCKGSKYSNKNQINKISSQICQLTNLREFTINNEMVEFPPPEIVKKGIKEIKNYFKQLEIKGIDYLYEAKLLIVGEGGAGKTSLTKKLENPNYQLQELEISTKGIDVITWHFKMENGKDFQVNIWDFGGQEIYHGTHQFFLTKRSLYALVADTRKEDTDFYYWLNIVGLLSDNSPLIIIKNEKQDRHREINESELRGQFANFKETLSTNLATNRGLPEVLTAIKRNLQLLPHIGTPLPKTWVSVREALERNSCNYIGLSEYIKLCKKYDFKDNKDIMQLSGYLHDLGICLHFQNDSLLNKIIILKPKWGTDAVYKVLDNKNVIQNLGHFKKSDLAIIWNDQEYDNMHDELLQLMINFRLCYKVPNISVDTYIAPQLLTVNPPLYEWPQANNLILRYSYEFMPKGILTQFIVAMHSFIENQCCVWKNGIVLEKSESRAEIIENYNKRELQIRTVGKNTRDLITIIAYELDKIHNTYEKLKCDKLIPCNCEQCKKNQNPHFYIFETLKRFIWDKQLQIQCQKSYQMVNVNELIDDVIDINQTFGKVMKTFGDIAIYGSVEQLIIQQTSEENIFMKTTSNIDEKNTMKSSWANGSFYLFAFVIVIGGLAFIAGGIPFYTLALIIIAAIIIVPMIGALQLRNDKNISEKNFLKLMRIVFRQLPVIKKFATGMPKVLNE